MAFILNLSLTLEFDSLATAVWMVLVMVPVLITVFQCIVFASVSFLICLLCFCLYWENCAENEYNTKENESYCV